MTKKKHRTRVKLQNDGKYAWISESKGRVILLPEIKPNEYPKHKPTGRYPKRERVWTKDMYVYGGKDFFKLNCKLREAKLFYKQMHANLVRAKNKHLDLTVYRKMYLEAIDAIVQLKAERRKLMIPKIPKT